MDERELKEKERGREEKDRAPMTKEELAELRRKDERKTNRILGIAGAIWDLITGFFG